VRLFLAALSITLAALLDGWVFQKLWEWFVTYHFHLAPLPFGIAVGLCLFASFATFQMSAVVFDVDVDDEIVRYVTGLVVSLLFLLVGWIVVLLR
jgi:hypothetical protein